MPKVWVVLEQAIQVPGACDFAAHGGQDIGTAVAVGRCGQIDLRGLEAETFRHGDTDTFCAIVVIDSA